MTSPTPVSMTENPAQNADNGSADNSSVTLKGLVFLLVLIAGVTALGGTSKGSHGVWSAVIGGGLALSNYMAFMWIWQRLTTATDEDAPKYMMLLTMKFLMAGGVMFLVFFALKPDAIFFLASYSALLPAMFFVTLLRG